MTTTQKNRAERFVKECRKIAEDVGVRVHFVCDEAFQAPFEDDGTLHVVRANVRACFEVSHGQSVEGREQNENTLGVLRRLGMSKKIGPRVLVEEDEDEEEDVWYCPHCGRECAE